MAATDHIKGVKLADRKLEKQRTRIVEAGKFWLLLSQDQGAMLRELLKAHAKQHPEDFEEAREIARLIRVRMKLAEKRQEVRKKKWASVSDPH